MQKGGYRKMNKIKHYIAMIICILVIFLPMFANADSSSKQIGLTVKCNVKNTEISLYQITDDVERGSYRLVEPFHTYKSKVKGLDKLDSLNSEEFRTLANTLEDYVIADKIKPISSKKLTEGDSLVWNNLSKGLYLIVGTQTKDEKYIYTPSPMLVAIPKVSASGEKDYHPIIKFNKFEKEEVEKPKALEVIKIWKDKGYKEKRPKEVTIELLRDGKKYEVVKLNAKNNWKYQWSNLSADYQWTVVEKGISDDYKVEYSKSGNKVYVINYYKEPEKTNKPNEPEKPKPSNPPKAEKLPQTGQMWWPVPILMVTGILFWLIGWTKSKIYEKTKD